ncbi:hypothetical protein [Natrinema sp. DC36]|uniref:hypothetical protein n=1 Tax=Natrinema sp. DC36 TaxID=2878680 RepID=UPI001CF0B00C|nr:hypothetical protein [Natrinema sp. DC36]
MTEENNMWPFEIGTIIKFATPCQGDLYAEVKAHTGGVAVVWWHPDSVAHTLDALEGRLFLKGIEVEDNYRVIRHPSE